MNRVIILGKFSPFKDGGIETSIREFLNAIDLKNSKLKIDVFCFGDKNCVIEVKHGIQIKIFRRDFSLFSVPFSLSMFLFLLRQNKIYGLVHIHLPNPFSCLLSILFFSKKSMISTFHAESTRFFVLHFFNRVITNYILKKSNKILVSAKENIKSYKLQKFEDKIKIMPIYISDSLVKKAVEQDDAKIVSKPYFLFVGRLVYYKGLEYLIKSMIHVDANLKIVGDGPLIGKLVTLVEKLGLEDRIKFSGFIPKKELIDHYAHCLTFILPSISISESYGISAVEAMSFGKPLVVTSIGTGLESLVVDGKNGFLIKPRDTDSLSRALNKILINEDLQISMGNYSREMFVQIFLENGQYKEVVDIYNFAMRSK